MIKPQNLLPNLSPRQPLEDEYISETDGLIYCSKCHTPRQKKIEFLGKIMFPIIRCQCQQEQYEKEEAKRKHQEFLEHISRLKSSGLQISCCFCEVPEMEIPLFLRCRIKASVDL